MALPVDTSTAFLRPSQLEALVRAVEQAAAHDEHDWVEWKRQLDLGSPEGRWHLAKQILGFSNRTVAGAARNAEGYAYILVGVEPGALVGVVSVDHAELTKAIGRYVGAVEWSPEYMVVAGQTVLVVVVSPPKPGQAAFCLRKGYDKHQAGAIFVRVPGRTEQATPEQIEALFERAAVRSAALDLSVFSQLDSIEAGPSQGGEVLEGIIEAERELLMAPERSTRADDGSAYSAPIFGVASGIHMPYSIYGTTKPDDRTEEQYEGEVRAYLQELRSALRKRFLKRRYASSGGALNLVVANPTDRYFKSLQLVVTVGGGVRRWPAKVVRQLDDDVSLPERPTKMGDPIKVRGVLEGIDLSSHWKTASASPARILGRRGYAIEDSGSVEITFDPLDVRPQAQVELPRVQLVVAEPPGATLLVEWKATSESTEGVLSGRFDIGVSEPSEVYE